ncbi:hypothetical protein [Haloarchaeobius sp. HME9146]|uniref:DUF7508 domain-containing protein n=1 Tax=Haloarchaeobius sp. HME9146 TaxID=2978732 RepID=UPI0021BF53B2|nr:hypothetical protein [Haloarchaeobius sp. HME9146]MCT9096923.1 hypothetical protein [Haloarchaeobius sp. HME9146]
MPLAKRWHDFDRSVLGTVPDRLGMYELGDEDGTVVEVGHGVLRDELKSALSYRDAAKVRWEVAQTREQASELAATHRDRL